MMSPTSPAISVIIPIHNPFNLLTLVVEGVVGQTLPVAEIIRFHE